jgi:release factor glutamine methyltransferase
VIIVQKIFRYLATRLYKPILANYLKKNRSYNFKPFKFIILSGVFHPAFFYSSKFLLQYLNKLNLENKNVIEVGAGSGLIAFNLALKAKSVIALELSKIAIKGLMLNQQNNKTFLPTNVLKIIESNLFEAIPPSVIDYIVVNPPYYPNIAKNETELAWNCGKDFDYFQNFFSQAFNFMNAESKIIMVLSSQCNINKINNIAKSCGFNMQLKTTKKFLIEDNYIFEITKK